MRLNGLDLNLLILLDALITEGSVKVVAGRLNMSQPAVSSGLSRLRQHFGDELLVVMGRRMAPTAFAASLAPAVAAVLSQARTVSTATPMFDPATAERTFTVVASEGLAALMLRHLARRLGEQSARLKLNWLPNSERNVNAFQRGEADVLLMRTMPGFERYRHRRLFEDGFSVVAWDGNAAVAQGCTAEQYLSARHVIIRASEVNRPSAPDVRLAELGHDKDAVVTVANYGLGPFALIGTDYLVTVPTQLALCMADWLPIRVLPMPIDIGTTVHTAHWNPQSDGDAGLNWLVEQLWEIAAPYRTAWEDA